MFLFGVCIAVRSALVLATYKNVPFMPIVLGVIGTGLIFAHIARALKWRESKGFFGSDVYWNSALHGAIYLLAALALYFGKPAWVILSLDVLLALYYFFIVKR